MDEGKKEDRGKIGMDRFFLVSGTAEYVEGRVTEFLVAGYRLHGGPILVHAGEREGDNHFAQAVVMPMPGPVGAGGPRPLRWAKERPAEQGAYFVCKALGPFGASELPVELVEVCRSNSGEPVVYFSRRISGLPMRNMGDDNLWYGPIPVPDPPRIGGKP